MIEDRLNYPSKDEQHLRLLVIFYRIMGIIILVFSSLFILYIYLIKEIFSDPKFMSELSNAGNVPPLPHEMVSLIIAIVVVMIIIGWTIGILNLLSARFIKRREKRMFIIIIACINCFSVPVGTALGVFTLVVMMRDSVVKLFKDRHIDISDNFK